MGLTERVGRFEWDYEKSLQNEAKHGIRFLEAILVFCDENRITEIDLKHSLLEERWICIGKIGGRTATVRYTHRGNSIRIIGAGYWRKGASEYEKKNRKKE